MENWTPKSHKKKVEFDDSSSQDWVSSQKKCILASYRRRKCSDDGLSRIKGNSFALVQDVMLEAFETEVKGEKKNYICKDCLEWFEKQLRKEPLRSNTSLFGNTHITFDMQYLFQLFDCMEDLIRDRYKDFELSYLKLLSEHGMEYQSDSSNLRLKLPFKKTSQKKEREQIVRTLTVSGVDESEQIKILDRLALVRNCFRKEYQEIANKVIQETEVYQREYFSRMMKSLTEIEKPIEVSVDGR